MGELSAEIRWWGGGDAPAAVTDWYESGAVRPGGGGARTDRYLAIDSGAVGIKYRGGAGSLEIKSLVEQYEIDLGDDRRGTAGIWIKHGLALALDTPTLAIAKRRRLRLFDCAEEVPREIALGSDEAPLDGDRPAEGCEVELTEVTRDGAQWWSVCFEAFGSLDKVKDNLARTMHHLAPLPEPLATARQASYPEWLAAPE
ncbi:MAG: hypothetical protein ABR601_11255 [Parasphingopyxis sp.]